MDSTHLVQIIVQFNYSPFLQNSFGEPRMRQASSHFQVYMLASIWDHILTVTASTLGNQIICFNKIDPTSYSDCGPVSMTAGDVERSM